MDGLPGEHWHRLSPARDPHRVSCDHDGLFVGPVPLLWRSRDGTGRQRWAARPAGELEAELGALYGLPVDMAGKSAALDAVARLLNRGNLALAKIAAVQLGIPALPTLEKRQQPSYYRDLIGDLLRSGMLKMA
jgi:hypothetical protein